jgi:uncharacterized protein
MILRRAANYRVMPWANGRGQTIEMLREDGATGLHLRLSIATVSEDGPFSLFPGVDRVLTVISGPGFHLAGSGHALHAAPLAPVAFPGDVAIAATQVTAPSEDFNVMTARHVPRPRVWVSGAQTFLPTGRLFLMPLTLALVNDQPLAARDLIETRKPVTITTDGPVIAVDLPD